MTQRVTDEQLVRWTRSNDSALNDVSADCQDARAEIAALRAKLAAVVVVYGGDGHYSHDALTKARAIVDAALKGAR